MIRPVSRTGLMLHACRHKWRFRDEARGGLLIHVRSHQGAGWRRHDSRMDIAMWPTEKAGSTRRRCSRLVPLGHGRRAALADFDFILGDHTVSAARGRGVGDAEVSSRGRSCRRSLW